MSALRVGIDATPISHGSRAIRRYVLNLVDALLSGDDPEEIHTLWVRPPAAFVWPDWDPAPRHRRCVTRVPGRVLAPLWARLDAPAVERLTGPLDVFHATQLEFPSTRAPLVWTIHGLAYLHEPELLDPRYVEAARRWHALAVARCAAFIAVSEQTRREFIAAHPLLASCCVTIPLGVGTEFTPGPPSGRPYILYVGAVARHKNIQGLLEAYDMLRTAGTTDARLVLVGPVDRAFWDGLRRGPYHADVELMGWLDQDRPELAAVYRGASAFAFPSFYEGWASPPLEAMASGVPVVTSNLSSLPETVGDAALLVDPHDAAAIAEGLRAVLEEGPLRASLIARGLARAAQFTWARVARETRALYQSLA